MLLEPFSILLRINRIPYPLLPLQRIHATLALVDLKEFFQKLCFSNRIPNLKDQFGILTFLQTQIQ